jgi:hypothetical protein
LTGSYTFVSGDLTEKLFDPPPPRNRLPFVIFSLFLFLLFPLPGPFRRFIWSSGKLMDYLEFMSVGIALMGFSWIC